MAKRYLVDLCTNIILTVKVFENNALELSEKTRENIVNFIKSFNYERMNESLYTILKDMLYNYFQLNENALFEKEFIDKLFQLISNKNEKFEKSIKIFLEKSIEQMKQESQSSHKNVKISSWEIIQHMKKHISEDEYQRFISFLYHFICMPRLDVNVTQRNYHPIKMPYCIHASTENVCAALSSEELKTFYPDENSVIKLPLLLSNESETKKRFETSLKNLFL